MPIFEQYPQAKVILLLQDADFSRIAQKIELGPL
jgi:hypothetical protein